MSVPFLGDPVGPFARRVDPASPEDSVRVVARRMRESGAQLLPLAMDGRLVGAISEASLAGFLAQNDDLSLPASEASESDYETIGAFESCAEAMRRFDGGRRSSLIVVDSNQRVVGVLRPSDLVRPTRPRVIPSAVGGMATPFGVYLTTGVVRAGASDLALISTGILMFCVLLIAVVIGEYAAAVALEHHASLFVAEALEAVIQYGLFLGAFRLLPLSGTHAAEHQVVHAIERGEELEPAIVARMPRVHPRCGTNLAVGAGLFVGLISWNLIPDLQLRALVSLVVTIIAWRPLGSLVQQYATTKRANSRQIANGIAAGNQLLDRTASAHSSRASFGRRLLMSGIFHVIGGACLAALVTWAVSRAFNLPIDLI